MPLYDFECAGCGHQFERRLTRYADANPDCPKCSAANTVRLFSRFSLHTGRGVSSAPQTQPRPRAPKTPSSPSVGVVLGHVSRVSLTQNHFRGGDVGILVKPGAKDYNIAGNVFEDTGEDVRIEPQLPQDEKPPDGER